MRYTVVFDDVVVAEGFKTIVSLELSIHRGGSYVRLSGTLEFEEY